MVEINRPRRGSLAYSPRKRAKSEVPRYKSWPEYVGEPRIQGFAGYKAGMTHIIMVDDHKGSPTEGRDVMVPVTIIETPCMKVAAIRAYYEDTYGRHALTEAWSDSLDDQLGRAIKMPGKHDGNAALARIEEGIASGKVTELYAITYTKPFELSGVPKKKPDLMEMKVDGGSIADQLELLKGLLGQEVDVSSLFKPGEYTDITAVTIGKGTQGPVKRWGIQVRKHKHSRGGKKRHIGNLGPWTPHHVRWQVPQMGQCGYHQRTEFNKRVLKIGENGGDVTPDGGFVNYGIVSGKYVLIKGSIPGPNKRLIRIRPAVRQGEHVIREPAISFISTESKQG